MIKYIKLVYVKIWDKSGRPLCSFPRFFQTLELSFYTILYNIAKYAVLYFYFLNLLFYFNVFLRFLFLWLGYRWNEWKWEENIWQMDVTVSVCGHLKTRKIPKRLNAFFSSKNEEYYLWRMNIYMLGNIKLVHAKKHLVKRKWRSVV